MKKVRRQKTICLCVFVFGCLLAACRNKEQEGTESSLSVTPEVGREADVTPEGELSDVTEPTAAPTPTTEAKKYALITYPTLYSDIPDLDIIRVGESYYMVSTTMNLCPGVPIMKSTDLVHWQIVNYVYDILEDDDYGNLENGKDMYGRGS